MRVTGEREPARLPGQASPRVTASFAASRGDVAVVEELAQREDLPVVAQRVLVEHDPVAGLRIVYAITAP